jgi:hypothetical protein
MMIIISDSNQDCGAQNAAIMEYQYSRALQSVRLFSSPAYECLFLRGSIIIIIFIIIIIIILMIKFNVPTWSPWWSCLWNLGAHPEARNRPAAHSLSPWCPVNIQWTFSEHSVNIQWTFREHSVNIQWTFSKHSVSDCRGAETLLNNSVLVQS